MLRVPTMIPRWRLLHFHCTDCLRAYIWSTAVGDVLLAPVTESSHHYTIFSYTKGCVRKDVLWTEENKLCWLRVCAKTEANNEDNGKGKLFSERASETGWVCMNVYLCVNVLPQRRKSRKQSQILVDFLLGRNASFVLAGKQNQTALRQRKSLSRTKPG